MTNSQNLTALLGSRICHDLISPIGAISNGLELLSLVQQATSPELALIEQSVSQASARIRLFRVAFGAGSNAQSMSRAEVQRILEDVASFGRFTFDWQGPVDLPRIDVKIALLAVLCLESAMPVEGQIRFDSDANLATVTGTSRRLRVDSELWGLLSGAPGPEQIAPSHVQFPLLADLLGSAGRLCDLKISASEIRLRFSRR